MAPRRSKNSRPKAQLSAATLLSLKAPARGFVEYRDLIVRGLSLRLFASGRASWSLRYRPKSGGARRRLDLGDYPTIGLAKARERADRHRGDISDGGDPMAKLRKEREAPTLGTLIEHYLAEEVKPKKKPRTYDLYKYYLAELVATRLRNRKAEEIERADVDKLHRAVGKKTPVTANRMVVALSGVYSFAEKRGVVAPGLNPARGIEKFREQSRERFLSTEELARLGAALHRGETEGLFWQRAPGRLLRKRDRKPENRKSTLDRHVAAAFRLLLFTGCRLREILHLRWSEVDLERGLLNLPDSKTGRKSVVLNAPALAVLANLPQLGDFVVLGNHPDKPRADLQRPWDLVRANAGLAGVRVHDLRHTHASIGAGAGLGLPIIGKLLGHKHQDTTARYAHLDADPLRRASNRIGTEIEAAMASGQTNIALFRRGGSGA